MFEYIHHVAYVVSDMDDAVRVFRDTLEPAFRTSPRKIVLHRPPVAGLDSVKVNGKKI